MTSLQDVPRVRSFADGEDRCAMIFAATSGIPTGVISRISEMEGVLCVEEFADNREDVMRALREMAECLEQEIDDGVPPTRIRVRAESAALLGRYRNIIEHWLLGEAPAPVLH